MSILYSLLLCLALAVVEFLIGGTRLVFSLPAYGLIALAGLISLADLRRPKLSANGWCLAATGLFLGYVLVRTLTSPAAYLAWADRYMVLAALVVYLLVACLLTDPRRRLRILAALLALAVVNLVIAARQFATGDSDMLFGFIRPAQYAGRPSGLYICPDHLAGYLEVVGCLALAIAFWSRNRAWVKLLVGYLGLCCFAGVLITGSRGGYLSCAAGTATLIVLGLLRLRATSPGLLPRALLAIGISLAVLAGGVVFALQNSHMLDARAKNLLDRNDMRLRLWPSAVQEFQLSPVVGTGSATFLYYGRKFRDPTVQLDPIRSHNDYLELLAEYGALGMLGLVLFLVAHLFNGWRAFQHFSLRPNRESGGSNAAAWNIGALAAVACMAVHSCVDFNLHIPANTLLMAFVFGQLANPGRGLTEEDHVARWRPIDLLPRLAMVGLSIWIMIEAMPKWPGEYFAEQARMAIRNDQPVAALQAVQAALNHDPDHEIPAWLASLGQAERNPLLWFYQGEAYRRLAERSRQFDTGGAAGDATLDFDAQAVEAYQRALALAPDDSTFLMPACEMLARVGDFSAAERVFETLGIWDPNAGAAQTYRAYYLQRAGRLEEAQTVYQRALALDSNPAAQAGLAEVQRELHERGK